MPESSLNTVRELLGSASRESTERLDNIWLLSRKTAEAMRKSVVYFKIKSWAKDPDFTLGRTVSYHTFFYWKSACSYPDISITSSQACFLHLAVVLSDCPGQSLFRTGLRSGRQS